MRLLCRTAQEVRIAPRQCRTDSLGGVTEGFSADRIALRGSVSYVNNTLNSSANALNAKPYGVYAAQALRIRFAGRAEVNPGDGALLPGEETPCWRCVEVEHFPFTTVARFERLVV